ncbi:MAG TPA: glycosyltransferase family 9 protein [Candidatus Acidoferrum sp.]|nr:glycosyltransferase family 9 protein [Candidatus Acidoferrum sp.]
MDIRFYRIIDRFIGPPICAVLSTFDRLSGRKAKASPPRKILIILLSEMGSLMLAHPMFEHLKQRYPGASLHILLFARNREVLDLLDLIPGENVLTLNDNSLRGLALDSFHVLRVLRALKIDVVIDCELFARVSSIFSYLSGAPVRVGFHRYTQEGLYRGSFINRPVLYNPYRHISQQFLALAQAVESTTVPLAKHLSDPLPAILPKVNISQTELQKTITRLHSDFPTLKNKSLVLVYASGGVLPIRAWPLEYYSSLCTSLLQDGHAIGIIGLKEHGAMAQAIIAHCKNEACVDLTGYTRTVRDLLALYQRASLLVTNDGAPGQFAALTSLPTLVFFGPETPVLYGPSSPNVHCLHLAMSCSPCLTAYNHRASPCDGDNQCLKQITPDYVLGRARALLTAYAVAASDHNAR